MDQLRSLADEFNLNKAQETLIRNATKGLDKGSELYKCLQKTKSLEDIENCFKKFGRNARGQAIAIEIKDNTKSVNDIDSKNAVYYKSNFETYASVYENHLKPSAKVPINGLFKIEAPGAACPPTQMKHDGTEYDIRSHPDISHWGVRSNICGVTGTVGASWIPDHVAQKSGVALDEVRCKKIDDFNVAQHKDVKTGKYILAKNYQKVKKQNKKLRSEVDQCRKAFAGNESVCVTEGFEDGNFVEVIDSTKQDYGDFNITNHKQYQNIMQNYVPRKELENECKKQFGIEEDSCKKLSEYPILEHPNIKDYTHNSQCKKLNEHDITKHKDISKYVLRSSVPTKEIGEYDISEHPAYDDFVKGQKDECSAIVKAKEEELDKKLGIYASKDKCGKITKCRPLNEYSINEHPDFENYVLKTDASNSYPNPQNINDHPQFDEAVRRLRLADQECARNFLNSNGASNNRLNVENFADVPQTKAPQTVAPKVVNNNPQGRFSVMNHKDYRYEDPEDGHMPKQECYRKYRDNQVPVTVQPKEMENCYKDIKEHPDYEAELLKHGAIRNQCGKIVSPPNCGLEKNKCGEVVCKSCPTPPPPVTESPHVKIDKLSEELMKSKLRLDVLMRKYRDLINQRLPQHAPVVKKCKFDIEKELKTRKKLMQIKKKGLVVTNKPNPMSNVKSVGRTKKGWVYKKNEMNESTGRYEDYNPNGMNYRMLAPY